MGLLESILNNNLPKNNIIQVIRFVLVGGFTASIDIFLLYLLVNNSITSYFLGAAISFLLASSLNYMLSIKLIFISGKYNNRMAEYAIFIMITFFGLLLNQLNMYLFVGIIGIYYLYSKAMSIVIVTIYNFLFKKYVIFKG